MEERNKKFLAAALGVAAVLAIVIGGYQAWLRVPPGMPSTPDDVEALLANARYQRLSREDKRPYQERINEMWGKLDEGQRKRLRTFMQANPDAQQEAADAMQQAMRTMYVNQIVKQGEQQRDAAMDGFIAMAESQGGTKRMREEANRERTPEEQKKFEEGQRRMWEQLDKGDPQGIGYFSEFMKLMQERRKERGMEPF